MEGARQLFSGDLSTGLEICSPAREIDTLCSLHPSSLAEFFTLVLWQWTLAKVMAIVCTNYTQCLTLSGEYLLKGEDGFVTKTLNNELWAVQRNCCCGSCCIFEFLGAGVVTTCDMWNKVDSSTVKWLLSRESSALVKFGRCCLWDSCISGKVQRNKCAFWWKCFLFIFS